jgi:hypothetical protein
MASQAAVVPQTNEIADEACRPRIVVMLERLLADCGPSLPRRSGPGVSPPLNVSKRPIAEVTAFPEMCMVFATTNGNGVVYRGRLPPFGYHHGPNLVADRWVPSAVIQEAQTRLQAKAIFVCNASASDGPLSYEQRTCAANCRTRALMCYDRDEG